MPTFQNKKMDLVNAHTFNLESQGSVYTQTVIKLVDGSNKLLVATLNRKINVAFLLHVRNKCLNRCQSIKQIHNNLEKNQSVIRKLSTMHVHQCNAM